MKEISWIIFVVIVMYLLASVFLYLYQRKLLYFPVALDTEFKADEIVISSQGFSLHGWVLNPGRGKAIIYFGGNSEMITHRSAFMANVFQDYSIYLINYRGYGASEGDPSETALYADALAIYDHVIGQHATVSAYGRSLGSGPAAYLAAKRKLERLILLTPYDSVTAVAQKLYPIFPVATLIKDRFDSTAVAAEIDIPVLLVTAEFDREIPLAHSLALKERLGNADLHYVMIAGAAHNDIVEFPQYRSAVLKFISR